MNEYQINDTAKLYYEAHVTIEPVFDERRNLATVLAEQYGFKLAALLMQKRKSDSEERSKKDTFMTAHSASLLCIKDRTAELVKCLLKNDFKVWRYKIEDTVLDSRYKDELNLLSK